MSRNIITMQNLLLDKKGVGCIKLTHDEFGADDLRNFNAILSDIDFTMDAFLTNLALF